jgi:hypothetical protein
MLKVLVTGSRTWSDYQAVEDALRNVANPLRAPVVVIHGDEEKGTDQLAKHAAWKLGYYALPWPAKYKLYGKPALMIRNREVLQKAKPDVVLAFLNGECRLTSDVITAAKYEKIPTFLKKAA